MDVYVIYIYICLLIALALIVVIGGQITDEDVLTVAVVWLIQGWIETGAGFIR